MLIEKVLKKAKKERAEADAQTVEKPEPEGAAGLEPVEEPPRVTGKGPPAAARQRTLELDKEFITCHRCLSEASTPKEIESYKILRTRIHHRMKANHWRTVMITSPGAGEGKTLTAVNLAISFAKAYDQTVLLVDCDFRRQSIHKCLGYADSPNLIDHILDQVPLQDTMVRIGGQDLVVISGERVVMDSAEILGSPQMMHLVGEMKNRYKDRIILFDLPPVLYNADSLAFAPWVDGILIVVSAGKTSMKELKTALNGLPWEKFLGYAFNRSTISTNGYYKYNYYSTERLKPKNR